MPGLVVQGVTKRFGARTVLDDVSFQLPPGQLALLSGRSGSGKSTLMAICAGLERPSAGRVLVGDARLDAMDEDERTALRLTGIGLVFQNFRLIPDLTVEENVRLPMTLAGNKDAPKRALRLLGTVGMADRADDFPETLSGGEAQRTAIARALANDPALVLADEPTANLDEENARTVMEVFRRMARDGRAILVAAHDPITEPYADRVLRITSGRLEAPGAPVPHPSGPRGAR